MTTTYRFGALDLLIGGAAIIVILAISVLLQRAGVAQPFAIAAAMAGGLLTLYPAMRRWSRAELPFYKWGLVTATIVLVGLSLHLLLLRI
jgi:putative flippase GtrA